MAVLEALSVRLSTSVIQANLATRLIRSTTFALHLCKKQYEILCCLLRKTSNFKKHSVKLTAFGVNPPVDGDVVLVTLEHVSIQSGAEAFAIGAAIARTGINNTVLVV